MCRSRNISNIAHLSVTDSHLPGDPPCRRITGFAQRPQRPPAPCARDRGGRPVRAASPSGGLWLGDLRPCIPQRPASPETRGSGSIASFTAVMLILFSFSLSFCAMGSNVMVIYDTLPIISSGPSPRALDLIYSVVVKSRLRLGLPTAGLYGVRCRLSLHRLVRVSRATHHQTSATLTRGELRLTWVSLMVNLK